MSARDHLLDRNDPEWNATVDTILAEHRAEVLREAADKLALEMGAEAAGAGPGFLLALRLCMRSLRRMADETARPVCGASFYTAVCRLAPHGEGVDHVSPDGDPASARTAYAWGPGDAVGRTIAWPLDRTAVAS